MGEHLPCKQGVKGSNPFISTSRNSGEEPKGSCTHLENRIYVKRNERVPERCRELHRKEHRKCADKR